jgi:hypothetical protein
MRIIAIIGLILMASAANAQEKYLSLNVYGGYTFTDRVKFDAAYADVLGNLEYGAGLEYFLNRDNSIELKYTRMGTDIPLYRYNGNELNPDKQDGVIQFITFGGNHYFNRGVDAKAIPFIGGALGVSIMDGPENSTTNFGWDVQAGVKLRTQGPLGFKVRAYIQSVTSAFGSDYWYYPGWGGYLVPDYVTLFQFGLGGVVTFDFGRGK